MISTSWLYLPYVNGWGCFAFVYFWIFKSNKHACWSLLSPLIYGYNKYWILCTSCLHVNTAITKEIRTDWKPGSSISIKYTIGTCHGLVITKKFVYRYFARCARVSWALLLSDFCVNKYAMKDKITLQRMFASPCLWSTIYILYAYLYRIYNHQNCSFTVQYFNMFMCPQWYIIYFHLLGD